MATKKQFLIAHEFNLQMSFFRIATAFAIWAHGLNNTKMTDEVKMVKSDRWKDDTELRQD